jgi:nicotinate-nucleotide adenylyltransferase
VGDRSVTRASDRLELVAAAVGDVEGLEPCALEIDRGGLSFTIDTIDELRQRSDDELYLIVGSDVAAALSTWKEYERVREEVTLVVMDRPGSTPVEAAALEGWNTVRVEVPALEISSSDVRSRVVAGRPLDFLVPEAAIRIIEDRGLYARSR